MTPAIDVHIFRPMAFINGQPQGWQLVNHFLATQKKDIPEWGYDFVVKYYKKGVEVGYEDAVEYLSEGGEQR